MNKILHIISAIILVAIGFCINAIFFENSDTRWTENPAMVAVVSAFIGALFGALVPVVIAPWYKDWYSRRKEVEHVKRRIKQYLSNIKKPFDVPFMHGWSKSENGGKQYNLSVRFVDLERSLSNCRFDKSVMLKDNDYRKILKYCYQQDISYFGLKSENEAYTKLFLKGKYEIL